MIKSNLVRTTTLEMSLQPTLLLLWLLALLSRAVATPVGSPSPTPRPFAAPVAKWATSTRIVTRTFPGTAGSSAELSRLFRTLPRMLLLLKSLPTRTILQLAVDVPNDLPPLPLIAGVTDTMTSAGKAYSSLMS